MAEVALTKERDDLERKLERFVEVSKLVDWFETRFHF
jgi:hypothetical protein